MSVAFPASLKRPNLPGQTGKFHGEPRGTQVTPELLAE